MAVYYNTSTITYDSATTPYDGVATVYTYAGNIVLDLVPSYGYNDGFINVWHYKGSIPLEIIPSHQHWRGFMRTPATYGQVLRLVPNSSMVIKQYYKTVKDPQVTAGCPQCGCLTYNQ